MLIQQALSIKQKQIFSFKLSLKTLHQYMDFEEFLFCFWTTFKYKRVNDQKHSLQLRFLQTTLK